MYAIEKMGLGTLPKCTHTYVYIFSDNQSALAAARTYNLNSNFSLDYPGVFKLLVQRNTKTHVDISYRGCENKKTAV